MHLQWHMASKKTKIWKPIMMIRMFQSAIASAKRALKEVKSDFMVLDVDSMIVSGQNLGNRSICIQMYQEEP